MIAYVKARVEHVQALGRNLSAIDVARFLQLRPSRQAQQMKSMTY